MSDRLPFPVFLILVPEHAWVPNRATAGHVVAKVRVVFGTKNATLEIKGRRIMTMLAISGNNVVLARNLTPADDGTYPFTVQATQNGVSVSASATLTIVAAAVPTAVTLMPSTPSLPDNSVANAQVSAAAVTMSDGSAFVGSLSVTGPA